MGDRRVLVLVEQHDAELVAQDAADLGPGEGQLGRERDLVAEVEQVAGALGRAVATDQIEQFTAGGGGLGHLAQVGVGEPGTFEGAQQFGVVRGEFTGRHEMFGEFGVEGQQIADQGGERSGEGGIRAGGLFQHPRGELVARGVGQQPGGRLQPYPQAVVGEELSGERVVRGDARLARRVLLVEQVGIGHPGPYERLADPLGQFTRGLVGEGEAEDLLGSHLAGAHQPHHARGHHRRLAGARPGDDHLRGGRCGDARRLLRSERDAEEFVELRGVGDTCGHFREAIGDH